MAGATTRARDGRAAATAAPGRRGRASGPRPRRALVGAALGCLGLGALSLLLPSTPSYDPWAWVVWGREVAALNLDTRFGPSWKPFPVLFTTPFSLFGEAAPALWLVVARAGALLGLVTAFRVARRLGGAFAGALAVVLLAVSGGYLRGASLGYSEGLLVAFVLLAFERHVEGRRGQALALGLVAGLLRPEVWPFLGVYALFIFVREPRHRALTVGLMALLPLLWLGPELWGSGDALRAATRARDPTLLSPAFAAHPWIAVLDRAAGMSPWPAKVGALVAVCAALAALVSGRVRAWLRAVGLKEAAGPLLALAAGGAGWLALVTAMTELGYAGNSRYLALPVAVCAVVGGVGLGWLARGLAAALARPRERFAAAAGGPPAAGAGPDHPAGPARERRGAVAGLAFAAVALVCVAFLAGPVEELAGDAREVAYEARLNADLPGAVARAGGRERVLSCGRPYATALQVPIVAWYLRVPTGSVGLSPAATGVLFDGPPALQPPDAPAPAPTAGGLRPVARVGAWTVSSAC